MRKIIWCLVGNNELKKQYSGSNNEKQNNSGYSLKYVSVITFSFSLKHTLIELHKSR